MSILNKISRELCKFAHLKKNNFMHLTKKNSKLKISNNIMLYIIICVRV